MTDSRSEDLRALRIDRESHAVSSSRHHARPWLWVPGLAVCGACAYGAWVSGLLTRLSAGSIRSNTLVASGQPSHPTPSAAPAVATAVLLSASGYIVALRSARVAPSVSARVTRVWVEEGARVDAGDTLFELDQADHLAAIDVARARARVAEAHLHVSRAQRDELALQRDRELKLIAAHASAAASFEDLDARVTTLGSAVAASNADVLLARADLRALEVASAHYRVVAPFSGVVASRPLDVGEMVTPSSLLLDLVALDSLVLDADVPESRLSSLAIGMHCDVLLDSTPDTPIQGEILMIAPRLNRAKATATVRVKLLSPPSSLRPEMAARVRFFS
ncbi:MAG: efflux RND transporter periplasmic adaptor subunit [Polyangiaceae bacterium]